MDLDTIIWRPDAATIASANITRFMRKHGIPDYKSLIRKSQEEDEWFWDVVTEDLGIEWFRKYDRVLDRSKGIAFADWYVGGVLNITHNAVDRHAADPASKDRIALIAETEDGQARRYTYAELAAEVNRVANGLKALGIGRGDTVGGYMPMIAEAVIAMFATYKIGAIFVPIFSGFAPPAVAERLVAAEAKLLFTADGTQRRGKPFDLKTDADAAVAGAPSVRHVVVARRLQGHDTPWSDGRDLWWDDLRKGKSDECEAEPMASMDLALMLFTSGTTGKPKGTCHSHAGTLVQVAKETGYYVDVRAGDVFWWVSDIGWMMGPWMLIGGLHNGATCFIYEGAPDYPDPGRLWQMAERHGVSVLGISPTAIRMLMRAGEEPVTRRDLSRLRILGSTGEPWDPTSYLWFFQTVGGGRCPIINLSGGTDIVGCFLSPLPICELKPCTLGGPGLGMSVDVFNEDGQPVREEVGYLVCTKPAPSMTRSLWKARDQYLEAYWSRWENVWNHGDWAKIDRDGYWFLFGRADDTIKVAGRRIGPGEIESALIAHDAVSEAAAISVPDPIKGEAIVCFAVLKPGNEPGEELRKALIQQVVQLLGKVDRPKDVRFVRDLPKTRSAKILRRLIKRCHLGEPRGALGDLSSLANPEALDAISESR